MSAEHEIDDFELPEAPVSNGARESAVFRALAHFEDKNQKAVPARTVHRSSWFADNLPWPTLRMALAASVVLLVAVPVGLKVANEQKPREEFLVADAKLDGARGVPVTVTTPASGKNVGKVAAAEAPVPVPAPLATPRARTDSAMPPPPAFAGSPAPLQSVEKSKEAGQLAFDGRTATGYGALKQEADKLAASSRLVPAPGPAQPKIRQIQIESVDEAGIRSNRAFGGERALSDEEQKQAAAGALPGDRSEGGLTDDLGRDKFANAPQNAFKDAAQDPVSTFSIDVDTASYSYVRASLNQNVLPQPAAVRTEEMINYFPYDYAPAKAANEPFSTAVTLMPNPWAAGRKLMRIGIKGYDLSVQERPAANLVFLIDTSGSMDESNKLPLLRQSLAMLVETLRPHDRVSIVAYAGSAGVVLAPTEAADKARILASLDSLSAGGSTAGGEGIRLAYQLAEANFDPKAVNRVMLATDGDFNVGITDQNELKGFVERERTKGIFLSLLGFGMGNLNDAMMQALAQNGNGVAAYIDTLNEARKVLVEESSSALFPIARDVKIQVEFNPAEVSEYRLIGYETRLLNRDDFNNDKVDAGEVGAGASVTAIYDIVPKGGPRLIDESRYAAEARPAAEAKAGEVAFLKIRYKLPKSDTSTLITRPVTKADEASELAQAPVDARFAVAVAGFGELLRGGKQTGDLTLDQIIALAQGARGEDAFGYRAEFVNLVRAAKTARGLAAQ